MSWTAEANDEFVTAVDRPALVPATTTWAPIALGAVLSGDVDQPPLMLARSDGHCLLYQNRIHALHAEPEALKTWLALLACAERLQARELVLYIDFEDSAASILQRLDQLGVDQAAILTGLKYIRPDEPLADAALNDLDQALEPAPAVAIIDGVTEAFSRQGLSPLDNSDVALWLDLLPRRLVRAGVAVLLLDHVVKDREHRGRYALGAQHKLAGVDVAYSLRVLEPFARGRQGRVAVKVEKDRPGRIREYADDHGQVALLRASSQPNGRVALTLEPPDSKTSSFRPTGAMERVSLVIEADPGLSKRAIRQAVGGKAEIVDLALELLIAEGHIEPHKDGQAIRHQPLKPYRENEDDPDRVPVSRPCPDRVPDTGEVDRVPVSHPIGDTDTGHARQDTPNEGDRVPANEPQSAPLSSNAKQSNSGASA